MSNERYERGTEVRARLRNNAPDPITPLQKIAPDFARIHVEVLFGEIYSRPGLELAKRQIVTISVAAALGFIPQLKAHINYGLNVGLTRDEIIEILMQVAIYAGWPRAIDGLNAADEVFATRANEPGSD